VILGVLQAFAVRDFVGALEHLVEIQDDPGVFLDDLLRITIPC